MFTITVTYHDQNDKSTTYTTYPDDSVEYMTRVTEEAMASSRHFTIVTSMKTEDYEDSSTKTFKTTDLGWDKIQSQLAEEKKAQEGMSDSDYLEGLKAVFTSLLNGATNKPNTSAVDEVVSST